MKMPKNAGDYTAYHDGVAQEMRDYYEQNKPIRWWQKRRKWNKCTADELMLGILNVVKSKFE